jgi:hypothetical protein
VCAKRGPATYEVLDAQRPKIRCRARTGYGCSRRQKAGKRAVGEILDGCTDDGIFDYGSADPSGKEITAFPSSPLRAARTPDHAPVPPAPTAAAHVSEGDFEDLGAASTVLEIDLLQSFSNMHASSGRWPPRRGRRTAGGCTPGEGARSVADNRYRHGGPQARPRPTTPRRDDAVRPRWKPQVHSPRGDETRQEELMGAQTEPREVGRERRGGPLRVLREVGPAAHRQFPGPVAQPPTASTWPTSSVPARECSALARAPVPEGPGRPGGPARARPGDGPRRPGRRRPGPLVLPALQHPRS